MSKNKKTPEQRVQDALNQVRELAGIEDEK